VRVRVPADQENGGQDFNMLVRAIDDPRLTVATRTRFFAGVQKAAPQQAAPQQASPQQAAPHQVGPRQPGPQEFP